MPWTRPRMPRSIPPRPLAIVGAALAGIGFLALRRRLAAAAARFRTSSSPSARLYDVLAGLVLGGLYDRVAGEIAAALSGRPAPEVLEIGPGPGRLALEVASRAPDARLTGLDIDPAMVERAEARIRGTRLGDRVRFVVGDVAAMPFPDAAFDLVVSSFSAHHWRDGEGAFREIARVLRPGGRAMIWDLPAAWGRVETSARSPLEAAGAAGWDAGRTSDVAWPGRRLSLVRRLDLVLPPA